MFFVVVYILTSACTATATQYIYDDLGRLSRIIDDNNNYLIYEYDSVGNFMTIKKGTASASAPVLSSISPDVLFIGSTVSVVISGWNLITTKSVVSGDPSISIKTLYINDTEIRADITVPGNSPPGAITITVTTDYGSASIEATLSSSQLSFDPDLAVLMTGESLNIAATISPGIGKDLTVVISNDSPSSVSAAETVTIPSSGMATFMVNALEKGVATISSGAASTVVIVEEPYVPEPGEEVFGSAEAVSVHIAEPLGSHSSPVSVIINEPASAQAASVSVGINEPASAQAASVSVGINEPEREQALPVSVFISELTQAHASPVSVDIGP
jgi:hypothetical protein